MATVKREKNARVTVIVPPETRDEVVKLAELSGVKPTTFMSMALIAGARQLARQMAPEHFMTLTQWRALAEAMGIGSEQAEKLRQALESQDSKSAESAGFRPGGKPRAFHELQEELPVLTHGEQWTGYMRGL